MIYYFCVGLPFSILIYLLIPSRDHKAEEESYRVYRSSVRVIRLYDWEKDV